MKIGTLEININPTFPVNRMLSEEKHLAVSDDLHCRIVVFEQEGVKPLFHLSIDTVEIYITYRNRLKAGLEEKLGYPIDLITSATHSHFCPCLTTDTAYQDFLYDRIMGSLGDIQYTEVENPGFVYQYHFFDKTGKSRISGHDSQHVYAETLSFFENEKRLVTFLIYNSHATTMRMHQGDFTSEYIGKCIAALKKQYPGEFFTFMLGPAGDISSRFTRQSQEYEEIGRLSGLLTEEYVSQLDSQPEPKPIDRMIYREELFGLDRAPVDLSTMEMPEDLSPRERETIEQAKSGAMHMDLGDQPMEHLFCHWIVSPEYSMIFEPFETFSSYYGFVDKEKCSLITISNGFDHYLAGLEPQRITMELFMDTVTRQTKERMAQLFADWSAQKDVEK
ncbi:MAG: hypothetical protein LUG61_09360 [Lachnospiraceae bacterium]|nr:hypothetical protein [Lachnospiraceae bacterium]